jgi:pilus assembly protein CpaB
MQRQGPPPRRRRLVRWVRRRQRLLATVLLALAAGTLAHALTAGPPQARAVVGVARDLPAGHVLTAGDVEVVSLPVGEVPDGAVPAASPVTGRVLASPVRRGEALTDARFPGPGLLAGAGPGLLAVPVPVDGPLPSGLVHPGDAVAVLVGTSAQGEGEGDGEVLLHSARVLMVSAPGAHGGLLGASCTSGAATGASGVVVVLALDSAQASRVAGVVGDRAVTLALLR